MDPTLDPDRGAPLHHPFRPANGGGTSRVALGLLALLLLAGVAGGAWYWWQQHQAVPVPAASSGPVTVAPAPAPPAPAAEPAIQHPIEEAPPAAASAPTLDRSDLVVRQALVSLLGQPAVSSMLQTDDFVRRMVATVDNLGRTHAPSRLWPSPPTGGRFSVQRSTDGEVLSDSNAARYDAFVSFVSSVDPKKAAATYRQLYPLFQRAYQELGYPKGYFNDRLVQVIDQMLATPELAAPPVLKLVEIKGPAASGADRPWTRYEFADPALEALPAGSKLLLRLGPVHAQRVKAQLRAFRAEVARR